MPIIYRPIFAKIRDHKTERHCGSTWPFLDNTHLESPAFATTSFFPRMTATHAVLPEFGPLKSEWGP
jgi:hypothetical protein